MKAIILLLSVFFITEAKSQITNQTLNFDVEVSDTTNFGRFSPTKLIVLHWEQAPDSLGIAMVRVYTKLIEDKPHEHTERSSDDLIPKSAFLSIVQKRNEITGAIEVVNKTNLNALLALFKLRAK